MRRTGAAGLPVFRHKNRGPDSFDEHAASGRDDLPPELKALSVPPAIIHESDSLLASSWGLGPESECTLAESNRRATGRVSECACFRDRDPPDHRLCGTGAEHSALWRSPAHRRMFTIGHQFVRLD